MAEVEGLVGDIDKYVSDTLRTLSATLSELSARDGDVDPDVRSAACDALQVLDTLGYLYSLQMEIGESRSTAVSGIALHISTYNPAEVFPGFSYSSSDGSRRIQVPEELSFHSTISAKVTLVAYDIQGMAGVLPDKTQNDTLGSDVIAVTFLDHRGHGMGVDVGDQVTVHVRPSVDMIGRTASCGYVTYSGGKYRYRFIGAKDKKYQCHFAYLFSLFSIFLL